MVKKSKIVIIILAVLLGGFLILSISVPLFGKRIAVSQIEENLKMKADLESISFGLPLSIKIKGLEIGGLAKIEKISISPSILGFFAGKVVLNKVTLINPVITLEQSGDGKLNLPQLKQGKQPPVLLIGLVIRNGKLIFTDKKIDPQGYKIIVDKINVDITKSSFPPTSLFTRFKISGSLESADAKALGSVDLAGWIDFRPKDMDGALEINDLDVVYFTPYLGDFISSKKLVSGKLQFSADLKAKNNDLNAKCHLSISNLAYKKEEPVEGKAAEADLFGTTLDIFAGPSGNLDLDFTVRTKLDKPQIKLVNLEGSIIKAAARNISNQPPQETINKVNNAIKEFKDFGKQMKELFKKKE